MREAQCNGCNGSVSCTEYLPTKKQLQATKFERKKIEKEKNFCVGKVRIRFDFSLHGKGRRKCPWCKRHTNSVNTVRLGLDGCVQCNVGLWPGVGAGTTYHNITTSQHGKRREIRGKKTQK